MANPDIARLEGIAREGRGQILRMLTHAGSGHPGGSLSVIDLLTVLYFNRLRYDPRRPDWEDRDRFVLSKGTVCRRSISAWRRRASSPWTSS
jgi:transketolase